MELSELDDCIKKGLLRKIPGSKQAAEMSISKSKMWFQEARAAFNAKIYSVCILASYEAMFHSARAILLRDGYRERSHYCIARYIENVYTKKGFLKDDIVNIIDNYRELRHNTAYGLESTANETDANSAVNDTKLVMESIEMLLNL